MKYSLIFTAIAAVSTVSAYQCPSDDAVSTACNSINVHPLVCNDPKVNIEECNTKQCGQTYVDNYSACQCRRSSTDFYKSSANVQGLLNRCGLAGLSNPYGDPNQYRPGQGTQTFVSTTTVGEVVTRIYDGTTYYGGQTEVISGTTRIVSATAIAGGSMILPGTTTWVSETPRILSGTSAALSPTAPPSSSHTAAHIIAPTENYNDHVSGGAIAGIVIGLLIMAALAGLLAACWRKKRHEYMSDFDGCLPHDINGPTRTVVTEKIEPVVVPSSSPHNIGTNSAVPAQTNYHMPIPTATTAGVHPIQHQTGVPINPTHSHTGVGINPIHPHIGVNNTVSNSVPPPPPITNSRMK